MDFKLSNSFITEFLKYFAASLIALLIDYTTYWFIAHNKFMELTSAGLIGYTCGLVVAYLLISKKVFNDGWLKNHQFYEFTLFILSGIIGLALTYFTIFLYVSRYGDNLHGAKLVAVTISFVFVYAFRKFIIFTKYHKLK
jgi:putative flippase GtrA